MQAWRDEWEAAWKSNGLDAVICPATPFPAMRRRRSTYLQSLCKYTHYSLTSKHSLILHVSIDIVGTGN